MSCNHHWDPVPGWRGRYRCPRCGVFGHRETRRVDTGVSRSVIPYLCRKCSAPAVAHDGLYGYSKEWRCAQHRRGKR
jgi:hypothetical protein